MGVLVQRSQEIKILLESLVVVAGQLGRVAILDMPWHLLPGPPIVQVIAALDLVRRGRRAP